ncbi:hypothetical protein Lbir_2984 [Legionella birminghamensis]|uniref:Uncharacterized protein n=1 Tax=Legionella birminghamensis TaxID=28083 RepID=A0A378I7T2_9GAMM|nr:hypothetical protein [Legionella birminghamensis]KTC68382.1 hypothetical protein Lbir_2984 [Legionella birminghamensis]STX30902.1 Uncharacterised protein [Legionella birminghamensis]
MKQKTDNVIQEPFLSRVANNVKGVKIGPTAIQAAGIQTEFATVNVLAARSFSSTVVLRSGTPPVYNKPRSPKSGLNLSKTSNQGFFKGALAADLLFTRVENGVLRGFDPKDKERLQQPLKSPKYQHTVQLPVNMLDILREIKPDGDLKVLGYDEESGQLRLAYKAGKGAPEFKGQFVINLKNGSQEQLIYSRPWDNPANQPEWDHTKQILPKPRELSEVPDEIYERFFHYSFPLFYSLEQSESPETLLPAKVFANTARTGAEFLAAMDKDSAEYSLVEQYNRSSSHSLEQILAILDEETIKKIYDQTALIVAGDWDGLLLSHPRNMAPEFQQVYNTFGLPGEMFDNMFKLSERTKNYLAELKKQVQAKDPAQLSPFDKLILNVKTHKLLTPYAVSRAGCITPHEFLFQQLINYAYRDHDNALGEPYNLTALQATMDAVLINFKNNGPRPPSAEFDVFLEQELQKALQSSPETSLWRREIYFDHLKHHAQIACQKEASHYKIPHPQHDQNVHDLYQHGFDMRNPYGCNIAGAWLMITRNGEFIYGDTEEQLIEVLLLEEVFFHNNQIDVNPHADMEKGWGRILELQQPPEPPLRRSLSEAMLTASITEQTVEAPLPPPRKAYQNTDNDDQNRVRTQDYRQQMEQLQQEQEFSAQEKQDYFNPQTGL